MEKLGLTMEDIKEAQKQAAAKKASGRSSAAQADGQKNGNGTVNAPKKREEQKGKAHAPAGGTGNLPHKTERAMGAFITAL